MKLIEGCGKMMHRPIGAHSQTAGDGRRFELLRVICRKSAIVIFQHLYCPH